MPPAAETEGKMKYENLVFDLYGTLVDIHTETDLDIMWEKTALYYGFYGAHYTPQSFREAYLALTAAEEGAAGQDYECFPELQIERIFEKLFEEKGVSADRERLVWNAAQLFRILSIDYIRLYPGVKETLQAFREEGHRLWLLSNAQRVFTAYEMEALGLTECFDGIYISSDHGYRKPDRRFFDALLTEQGIRPEEALMIGNDLQTDIAGGRNAGMKTLYIHSNLSPAKDGKAAAEKAAAADYRAEGADWFEIGKRIRKICLRG